MFVSSEFLSCGLCLSPLIIVSPDYFSDLYQMYTEAEDGMAVLEL